MPSSLVSCRAHACTPAAMRSRQRSSASPCLHMVLQLNVASLVLARRWRTERGCAIRGVGWGGGGGMGSGVWVGGWAGVGLKGIAWGFSVVGGVVLGCECTVSMFLGCW